MRRALTIAAMIVLTASAATRIMDVAPHRNCNGKVSGGKYQGISQSFACSADSLLWAEFFVGEGNADGQYLFQITTLDNRLLYQGMSAPCGPFVQYEFVRANLVPQSSDPLIKGKSYVLKITHTQGESLNFYYDPTNAYEGGQLGNQQDCDLACRIEGVNEMDCAEDPIAVW